MGECRRRGAPCEGGREKWWEVLVEEPGSQSSCARSEGNAESGAGKARDIDSQRARTPPWRARGTRDLCRLCSCSCCRCCCSELVSVVGAAPAGERGDGAGGYRVSGVLAPEPGEVSDPTLRPGAGRPSVQAWRTGGGGLGCQEGAAFYA